jgi:hypothetical protein
MPRPNCSLTGTMSLNRSPSPEAGSNGGTFKRGEKRPLVPASHSVFTTNQSACFTAIKGQPKPTTCTSHGSASDTTGARAEHRKQTKANIAQPLVKRLIIHFPRHDTKEPGQGPARSLCSSDSMRDERPPSPTVTNDSAESDSSNPMFCSALSEQAPFSTEDVTQIPTDLSSQRCFKDRTSVDDGRDYECEGVSVRDISEGEDAGL